MKFILKELEYFRSLPQKARDLLVSYFFFGASYPLIGTFVNAFIWRNQGDIVSLAYYNIGNTIMLPLIFYFNGLFLKKLKINHLYFFGALLTAIIPITIVFFPKTNPIYYLIFGFLFGIGYGLYWANRNYFTYKETASHNRDYFLGINFSLSTFTGIVVPLIVGWFIFFTGRQGYQVSIILAFILLFLTGLKLVKDPYQNPKIEHIFIKKTTIKWWAARILALSIGIVEGISLFFPTLLILTKLGAENILGSFNSILQLLTAVLLYYYGRRAMIRHQLPVLLSAVFIGLLGAGFFGLMFNSISVIVYLVINYLALEFMWITAGPIMMNIMDKEKEFKSHNIYALIFDQELFLDLGRILSFAVLFLIIYFFGQQTALRYSPISVYLLQLIFLTFVLKKLQ